MNGRSSDHHFRSIWSHQQVCVRYPACDCGPMATPSDSAAAAADGAGPPLPPPPPPPPPAVASLETNDDSGSVSPASSGEPPQPTCRVCQRAGKSTPANACKECGRAVCAAHRLHPAGHMHSCMVPLQAARPSTASTNGAGTGAGAGAGAGAGGGSNKRPRPSEHHGQGRPAQRMRTYVAVQWRASSTRVF